MAKASRSNESSRKLETPNEKSAAYRRLPGGGVSFSGVIAHTVEAESAEEAFHKAYKIASDRLCQKYESFLDVARALKVYKHAVIAEVP